MRRSRVRSSCGPPTFAHRGLRRSVSFGWASHRASADAARSRKATQRQRDCAHRHRSMPTIKKIGVLTGGGDAPGLNAVIRAVVKAAHNSRRRGRRPRGQLRRPDLPGEVAHPRRRATCTGILRLGGTILGTVNRGDPFAEPIATPDGTFNYADRVIEMFQKMELDALVCIGGDGTLAISYEFYKKGIPLVCVPKTIDNDIVGTTSCFGFDTAVELRHRCHRSAAHDGRSASPDHGRRGDGPLCRVDRAAQRRGRRRRRHPDSGDSVRPRRRSPSASATATRGARASASSSWPKARTPKDGKAAVIEEAHGGHAERLGGEGMRVRQAAGGADRQGNALRRARPPAARRQRRRRSIARWPRGSAARPWS